MRKQVSEVLQKGKRQADERSRAGDPMLPLRPWSFIEIFKEFKKTLTDVLQANPQLGALVIDHLTNLADLEKLAKRQLRELYQQIITPHRKLKGGQQGHIRKQRITRERTLALATVESSATEKNWLFSLAILVLIMTLLGCDGKNEESETTTSGQTKTELPTKTLKQPSATEQKPTATITSTEVSGGSSFAGQGWVTTSEQQRTKLTEIKAKLEKDLLNTDQIEVLQDGTEYTPNLAGETIYWEITQGKIKFNGNEFSVGACIMFLNGRWFAWSPQNVLATPPETAKAIVVSKTGMPGLTVDGQLIWVWDPSLGGSGDWKRPENQSPPPSNNLTEDDQGETGTGGQGGVTQPDVPTATPKLERDPNTVYPEDLTSEADTEKKTPEPKGVTNTPAQKTATPKSAEEATTQATEEATETPQATKETEVAEYTGPEILRRIVEPKPVMKMDQTTIYCTQAAREEGCPIAVELGPGMSEEAWKQLITDMREAAIEANGSNQFTAIDIESGEAVDVTITPETKIITVFDVGKSNQVELDGKTETLHFQATSSGVGLKFEMFVDKNGQLIFWLKTGRPSADLQSDSPLISDLLMAEGWLGIDPKIRSEIHTDKLTAEVGSDYSSSPAFEIYLDEVLKRIVDQKSLLDFFSITR
ncbi:MAG: hypothetical protein GF390_03240 [Candidatus Pacebacteria bacterium]|nr:hypothetical protein [Candidatus Paceibacterota bacterium]